MSHVLPINNSVRIPSTSSAYENGYLPRDILVQVPQVETVCLMDPTAARAFEACFAEAKRALNIRIKDVGDYRSFQAQFNLFVDQGPNTDGRYIPVSQAQYNSTPSAHRKRWLDAPRYGFSSTYWVKNYAKFGYWPATAATPGTSNHGRALALDVAEEYDSDTAPDGITHAFVGWLCDNGPRYGIYASLQSEPWHWQYVMGDSIPQAVLDYERGDNPPPEDNDMIELERPIRAYDSRPTAQADVDPVVGGVNSGVPRGPLLAREYREIYVGFANRAAVQVTYIAESGPGFARLTAAGVVGTSGPAAIGADTVDRVEYGPVVPLRLSGGRIRVTAGPGSFDFAVDVYATDTGL